MSQRSGSDEMPPGEFSSAELRQKALDFQLEKTYAALVEAGKGIGAAFPSYVLMMSLTALLIFGQGLGLENKIMVPILQVSVERYFAAMITLALGSCTLWWFYSGLAMENLLIKRLHKLFDARFGNENHFAGTLGYQWVYRYPSVFRSGLTIMAQHERLRDATKLFVILFFIGTVILPIVLAIFLGIVAKFAPLETSLLVVLTLISVIPSVLSFAASQDQVRRSSNPVDSSILSQTHRM